MFYSNINRKLYYGLFTLSVMLLQANLASFSKSIDPGDISDTKNRDFLSNSQKNDSPELLYKAAENFQHYGQLDQAEAKYREAREAVEKLLGSNTLELARCDLRLATIYDMQKKSKQSAEEWNTTFKICKRALGDDFRSSKFAGASKTEMLAENNQAVKEIKNQHYPEAISILESVLRRDPNYKLAKDNLSVAYQNYALFLQNTPNQALSWMRRAIYLSPADQIKRNNYDGLIKLMGKDPSETSTHIALGAACNEAGDIQGAIVEYSRALEIDPSAIPNNYPLYGRALGLLGERQSLLDKRIEAEESLKQSLSWMEQHKTASAEIKRYARDLADLYKVSNRADEANEITKKFLPAASGENLNPEQSAALTEEQSAAQKKLNEAANNFSDRNYKGAQKCLVDALPYLEKNKETMASALAAAQYDLLLTEDKQNLKLELAKYLPGVVEYYLHNGWISSINYDPYIAELDKEVKSYWNPPHLAKTSKRTLLRFKIGRFGDFSDVKIESSSGLIPLDDAAIEAFEKVGRAKPLPDGSPDSVEIEFHFDYNIHHTGENTDSKASTW